MLLPQVPIVYFIKKLNKIIYYNMSNALIVVIILLIVLIVLVASLFFINYLESDCEDPDNEGEKEKKNKIKDSRKKEVYNIRPNIFTYEEAKAICKAQDPPATLASLKQIESAYKKGADWCNYGWSKDQLALYPTQKDSDKNCGKPGVNGGYFSRKESRFGVNCYGVKRSPNEEDLLDLEEEEENEYDVDINDKYKINPFNKEKWSGVKE